jgi:hypothetical protein
VRSWLNKRKLNWTMVVLYPLSNASRMYASASETVAQSKSLQPVAAWKNFEMWRALRANP